MTEDKNHGINVYLDDSGVYPKYSVYRSWTFPSGNEEKEMFLATSYEVSRETIGNPPIYLIISTNKNVNSTNEVSRAIDYGKTPKKAIKKMLKYARKCAISDARSLLRQGNKFTFKSEDPRIKLPSDLEKQLTALNKR